MEYQILRQHFFRLQPRHLVAFIAKLECVTTHRLWRSYWLEYFVTKITNPCLLILLLRGSQHFSC